MDTSIQKYQAFVTTVETGSFSLAAKALSYSQSGISRMIADLESEWKVHLLERGRSGVRLTSDGMKLLPYARSLILEYEKMRHAIDGLAGLEGGLLRIGIHSALSAERISEIIGRFAAECPGIDYEIRHGSYTQIEDMVRTGRLDLGLSRFPAQSGLEGRFLLQEGLVAVISAGVGTGRSGDGTAAVDGTYSIADLNGEPFVLFESEGQDDVAALLRRCSVAPDIRAVSDDPKVVAALAADGIGNAILPEGSAADLPDGLMALPLDVPAYISTGLIVRSRKSASIAVRRFLEIIE